MSNENKKKETGAPASEWSDLLDDESSKATKVRIAWSISGKQGHGEGHDLTCIDHLQQTVDCMNREYGQGAHLLAVNEEIR